MVNKSTTKIISIILLLCSFFIPMFNIFPEGLMPDEESWFFTETFVVFIDEGIEAFSHIGVVFHLAAWIPAILVCIGAFLQKEKMVRFASIIGIIILVGVLLFTIVNLGDAELVHPIDGNICIGYWLDLVLFAVCAFSTFKKVSSEGI